MPHKIKKTRLFFEFVLMFYLLELTGNLYFRQNVELFTLFTAFFSIPFLFNYNLKLLYKRFLMIIIFIIGYEFLHSQIYHLDYSKTMLKILLWLLFGYSSFLYFGNRFIVVLTNTMVVISVISLVFTFLGLLPGVYQTLYDIGKDLFPLSINYNGVSNSTLIIYSFDITYFNTSNIMPRNPGVFWEAGAFGTFLNLSLFLYYIHKKPQDFKGFFDRTSIILISALLTTFSTTSYIVFAIIILLFTLQFKLVYKILFLPIFLVALSVSYVRLDFLNDKIEMQLGRVDDSQNRFASVLLDWEDIKRKPLIGWSRRTEVLFGEDHRAAHRPNGITNLLRSYGFIYFSIYLFFVYRSFNKIIIINNYKKIFALFGMLILVVLAFSQLLFNLPFFLTLPFLAITLRKKIPLVKY